MNVVKSLGQHFLKDEAVLQKIVNEVNVPSGLQLVEIGVGLGHLTKKLLCLNSLIVYEIDIKLVDLARRNFKFFLDSKRLILEHKDVLKLHNGCESGLGWLYGGDYFLVSNLPYCSATRIILDVLRDSRCKGFVVMTQREVGRKFCAAVAHRDFCALSVIIQSMGRVEYCFDVGAESFDPRPKVVSGVFKFHRECVARLDSGFYVFLRRCFSHPRKKLLSNLRTFSFDLDLRETFVSLGLDSTLRPHEVSAEQYMELFERTKERGKYE